MPLRTMLSWRGLSLVHPAKAVGWNDIEMSFDSDRNTRLVSNNSELGRGICL